VESRGDTKHILFDIFAPPILFSEFWALVESMNSQWENCTIASRDWYVLPHGLLFVICEPTDSVYK
jgi:hypothetical protein